MLASRRYKCRSVNSPGPVKVELGSAAGNSTKFRASDVCDVLLSLWQARFPRLAELS